MGPGDTHRMSPLSRGERRFAESAIRRRRIFLGLSIAGVAIAIVLAAVYGFRFFTRPDYPVGTRSALVILILLNARQNLRQYRYAGALARLTGDPR